MRLLKVLVFCAFYSALSTYADAGFNLNVKKLDIENKSVYFAPFDGVGVVTVKIAFKGAGQKIFPKEKEILVGLLERILGEATTYKNKEKILDFSREHNLNIAFSSDDDNFIITGSCVSSNLSKLFALINDFVFHSAFKQADIVRIKDEIQSELMQAMQMPGVLLNELKKSVLMANHPYGVSNKQYLKSIKTVDANDLKSFMKNNFALDNVCVAVSGDIDEEVLKHQLTLFFKSLQKKSTIHNTQNITVVAPYSQHHVQFPVPQTMVRMVHKGIDFKHPDFFALQIASICLSDSNVGILWQKVRKEEGLAYGITSHFDIMNNANFFCIDTATGHENVAKVQAIIKYTFKEVLEKGFNHEAFNTIKSNFLGNYKRSFSSSSNIAMSLVKYQLNGFDENRYQEVIKAVESLTLEDVNNAFRKFFNVDEFHVFTVGN